MRSIRDVSTTRARIRDAAILLIGRQGFAATSARAVAAEAGVSAGLVIHHFTSMHALKTACDDFIVTEVTRLKAGVGHGDISTTITEWYSDLDTYQPWLNYLSRLFTDDSEAGAHVFDRIVDMTTQILDTAVANKHMTPSSDPHARALLLVTHSLSTLILQDHIARTLGSDRFSAESLSRLGNSALELYTEGLYVDSSTLNASRTTTATATAQTEAPQPRHVHDPDADPPTNTVANPSR